MILKPPERAVFFVSCRQPVRNAPTSAGTAAREIIGQHPQNAAEGTQRGGENAQKKQREKTPGKAGRIAGEPGAGAASVLYIT